MVRWWSGTTWSDVATPAGPGVAVQSSPVLAPPTRAAAPPAPPAPVPSGTGHRAPWIVGISLLVILAVVGAALVLGRSGSGSPVAAPAVPSSQALPPAGPTFAPGTVRIVDDVSGVSYPFLGGGWYEWALWNQQETTHTAGQYFTTQEVTPDGKTFISQCSSGPLADGYGWAGPSTLRSTLATVADSVRLHYYPGPNERKVLRDEARTIDGHAAHLYEFQLSWDVPGYDASGERAALLLIDVGRPAPALLYISIPNTHAELYGVIDRVLDSVDVL
ncbi:MAG: hypothetical protein JWQ37_853 [Blastococcus sp.]|nr:hypothetical protein [Blastococcus sp.]